MATLPQDVVNRALDAIGVDPIGDLGEGGKTAEAARRVYVPTVKEIFSAAHWNFCRKQDTLVLIADASGQTADVDTTVQLPWLYEYAWPTDCLKARFVPRGLPYGPRFDQTVCPFLPGTSPRPSDEPSVEGLGIELRKAIYTNEPSAQLVYTAYIQYPDMWDHLFIQAVVCALAYKLARPCIDDPKIAAGERAAQQAMLREALDTARVRDGNEGWTINNHTPDWIAVRSSGLSYGGVGVWLWPWDSLPYADQTF